jgi:hypothetical protein
LRVRLTARRETHHSGAAKVIYRDADGNEISFGGSPDGYGFSAVPAGHSGR